MQSRFRKAELSFEEVRFNYSFRSGAAILQSVDYVFRDAGDLSRRSAPMAPAIRCIRRSAMPEPSLVEL
ncbi:MAG: hypothetical protein MZV49_20935 [Rhodopseudomonas palustris]|nr:hypothetical protein [Rhodopseudomonas palustris]